MANTAAIVGCTITAVVLLIAALLAAWKKSKNSPEVDEAPKQERKEVEIKDVESASTNSVDSAPEEEEKPKRTKASTCDVRNCQSFSCTICQFRMQPEFHTVQVKANTVQNIKEKPKE
mmetsp:Transcript_12283/g.17467  ORF Transcript_12283/g.17467 Transcript_12283/m.17467 type:complete len:118 (-) Transcript_12283:108-461(-)